MTATPLTETEQATLRCIAGHMIPASAEHGVPGADDPAIFADIVRSVERDLPALRDALVAANAAAGGDLASLSRSAQDKALAGFRADRPALAGVIEAAVARCYYRDDRVMAAIGMEPRPPFPAGYAVVRGDWSLLEPVRARGRIYRDADQEGTAT